MNNGALRLRERGWLGMRLAELLIKSWYVSADWTVVALAMMFLTSYRAAPIHPFMAIRVFNPRVRIVHRIQDNVTMYRLFSHTLQPLFVLLAVRTIKFLFASRLVFLLQKLGAKQATALHVRLPGHRIPLAAVLSAGKTVVKKLSRIRSHPAIFSASAYA
jgi:hypothetical protein